MNALLKKIFQKASFFAELVLKNFYSPKKVKLLALAYPYTMVGYKRLSNAYELAKKASNDKIGGAFVECGVWKGGCSAVMAFVADKEGAGRKMWLFDSFEGLPEPTPEDGKMAKDYASDRATGGLKSIDKCVGPLEEVKKIFFEILEIDPKNAVIKKGWFQDTLPESKAEIGPISVLRLDGDWYESTKCCLDNLYDLVTKGGYVIIDDYGHWEGSRKAVDEFFKKKHLNPSLVNIDYTGVYFRKS